MRFSISLIKLSDKKQNYMIALFPDKNTIDVINNINDIFDLANKLEKPDFYHVTLRYWRGEDFNDIKIIKDYLINNDLNFDEISCKITNYGLLGKDNAFVLHLESKELMNLQKKLDDDLQKLGVPSSDYPSYLPHLSLGYGYKDIDNKFANAELKSKLQKFVLTFNELKLTGNDYKVILEI